MTQIHKRAKVIGSPGTGKTTYLLELIEKAAQKYQPERIGAVSLTNAAIEEMRDRVKKATGLSKATAKNIRTIHSTCFNLLNLKKEQVADKKIKEFNEAFSKWQMPLSTEITEDEHYATEYGYRYTPEENKKRFQQIQILRHKMTKFEKWPEMLQQMHEDWKHWMNDNNYIDFTGMLELVLWQGLRPNIDILLVDEAQDVSSLAIAVLELWSEDCVSTVYVGDSDQAILRFAGAVPEAFINLNHTWTHVLEQSYRVPRKVHEYAMSIIRQAENREDVDYLPTEIEGQVIKGCHEPDLSLDGTHMILGRCNFHLNRWRDWLIKHGVTFHNPYRPGDKAWNPLNTKLWRAARNYMQFKDGVELKAFEFAGMIKEMRSEGNLVRGVKKDLDGIIGDVEFFDLFAGISLGIFTDEFLTFRKEFSEVFNVKGQSGEVLLRVQDIMEEPKTIIGTIHSIKGGEADNVWIDTGTSWKCLKASVESREAFYDECRVGYVGVTRGRFSVGLMEGGGRKSRVWG